MKADFDHLPEDANIQRDQLKKKDIKILLIDDEPDILEIVGYNLSSEGYQVLYFSYDEINHSMDEIVDRYAT